MKKAYKQPDLPTSTVGSAAHLHREFFVQGCDVSVHKLWIQRLQRSGQLQQRMWPRRVSWRRIKIAKEVSKQSGQRTELAAESKSSPQQIGGG